jgi:hypothetical protein
MKYFGFQNHRLPSVGMELWRSERSVTVAGRRTAEITVASHSEGTHHQKSPLADSHHAVYAVPHR